MPTLVPSDIYPAVRRFLLENGLSRALKAFDKETTGELAVPVKPKKARALANLELTEACQLWFDGLREAPVTEEATEEPAPATKRKRRKSQGEDAIETPADEAKGPAEAAEERTAKKRKRSEATADAEDGEAVAAPPAQDEKKKDKDRKEKKQTVPFSRVDASKWISTTKDSRLLDNTHKAKNKFGTSAGDSWGDKAAEDLLKVKGKGFRKEMAKKKRASWKGGGEIDQGVNSIKFSDSEDE
mmetsp:Transcript_59003/g.171161  ORF Transcript_59003/g.171161 Transcript_59003/m.171161 type:complete len:242 (-) Transcript_59003:75-800(-)